MAAKSFKIYKFPTQQEYETMASRIAREEQQEAGTPFSMEEYWSWLEKSDYYQYVNLADVGGNGLISFGPFSTYGTNYYFGLSVAESDVDNGKSKINIGRYYSCNIPFTTLEGAINATTRAIDLTIKRSSLPSDKPKPANSSANVYQLKKQYETLFAEKAKGSGLRFGVTINEGGLRWRGVIDVKVRDNSYLIFPFSAGTKDKSFEQMVTYAVGYKNLLEECQCFNCEISM